MDVQTYMLGIGKAARTASRAMAVADTRAKNTALTAMAAAIERAAKVLLRENARDLEDRPADTDPGTHRSHGRRPAPDRGAARSGRRNQQPQVPPDRHPGGADARAAGRYRHHLRVAAERHRRRRGAVPEIRQRGDFARRFGSAAFEPGHRRLRARRTEGRGIAGGRGAGDRNL